MAGESIEKDPPAHTAEEHPLRYRERPLAYPRVRWKTAPSADMPPIAQPRLSLSWHIQGNCGACRRIPSHVGGLRWISVDFVTYRRLPKRYPLACSSVLQREIRCDSPRSVFKRWNLYLITICNSIKCTLINLISSVFPSAGLRWPLLVLLRGICLKKLRENDECEEMDLFSNNNNKITFFSGH